MTELANDPNQPPGMSGVLEASMQASGNVAILMAVGLAAVKLAYYIWGLVYVRGEEARSLFSDSAAEVP